MDVQIEARLWIFKMTVLTSVGLSLHVDRNMAAMGPGKNPTTRYE